LRPTVARYRALKAEVVESVQKRRLPGAVAVLDRLEHNPSHGEVYWFLWDQYDAIVERTRGRRMPWKTLLDEIQKLGLTNGSGKPLDNIRTLQSTWAAVQRDKRRQAEAKQQRATENRRPTNEPPPVVARTVAPPAVAPRPSSGPVPFVIKTVPRHVIEEEARRAAERRPDLFPHGPDITRYKILKESGKRL